MISPTYRETIHARLNARLRDVRERAIAERIAQEASDRHRALLRRAQETAISIEPDPGHPGRFITRAGEGYRHGGAGRVSCNLTTAITCTCAEFQVWHRCPCQALVIESLQRDGEVSAAA